MSQFNLKFKKITLGVYNRKIIIQKYVLKIKNTIFFIFYNTYV